MAGASNPGNIGHAWVKALSWPELRASLILLAMTFLALPLLPDRGFGPNQSILTFFGIWLYSQNFVGRTQSPQHFPAIETDERIGVIADRALRVW